jgi:uncharacterized protein (TIGR03435 family)
LTVLNKDLLALGVFGLSSRLGDRIQSLLTRGRAFSPHVSAARVGASATALLALAAGASFAPSWIAFAQQPDQPAFEVASIRPAPPGGGEPSIVASPGGRLVATNITLERLVRWAYSASSLRISGQPDWFSGDRFNVVANAPDGTANDQLAPMLQRLLADRFKLSLHRETKESLVYALVVGKGGFRLREIEYRGTGPTRLMRKGTVVELSYPAGADLAQFAGFLSGQTGRPVLDRTGLTGVFDIKLEFAPEPPVPLADAGADRPANDTAGPSIFTAVQEQLGLRLESARGPVEILVIDHAERPDAN